ncbi:MAG: hypothetical protein O3B64_03565 [bacterium]|nr:hypothetical protein [bacterium]
MNNERGFPEVTPIDSPDGKRRLGYQEVLEQLQVTPDELEAVEKYGAEVFHRFEQVDDVGDRHFDQDVIRQLLPVVENIRPRIENKRIVLEALHDIERFTDELETDLHDNDRIRDRDMQELRALRFKQITLKQWIRHKKTEAARLDLVSKNLRQELLADIEQRREEVEELTIQFHKPERGKKAA